MSAGRGSGSRIPMETVRVARDSSVAVLYRFHAKIIKGKQEHANELIEDFLNSFDAQE